MYITQQKSLVRAPLKVNFFLLIFLRWVKNYIWTRRLRELLRSHWVQSAITDENNIKKDWMNHDHVSIIFLAFDFRFRCRCCCRRRKFQTEFFFRKLIAICNWYCLLHYSTDHESEIRGGRGGQLSVLCVVCRVTKTLSQRVASHNDIVIMLLCPLIKAND